MRRLKRHSQFELRLNIEDPCFIAPPRDSQRQWLINRALTEFSWDLEELDCLAARFVPGCDQLVLEQRNQQQPDQEDIMELWQLPILEKMADLATARGGNILEIGYGRGISAKMIQERNVDSHTIVECVPAIARQCRQWAEDHHIDSLTLLEGRWEEVIHQFEHYDGIFFHTYPMDEEEYAQMTRKHTTLAEPFFPVAAKHLNPGGVFTYFTNEIDSLSRGHQRALLNHFPANQSPVYQ